MKIVDTRHFTDGNAALRQPAEGEALSKLDPRLEAALARVRRDAGDEPEAYARDTEVPFGGE